MKPKNVTIYLKNQIIDNIKIYKIMKTHIWVGERGKPIVSVRFSSKGHYFYYYGVQYRFDIN